MRNGENGLFGAGILLVAVYHEFAEQELGNEVCQHGHSKDNVFVDTGPFCQGTQPGGQGSKDQVEAEDFGHGDGHIGGRLEGVAAVQREIPQNRKDKRGQISWPVGPMEQFIDQGEGTDLDDAC